MYEDSEIQGMLAPILEGRNGVPINTMGDTY
jgi:hypothetical protein